MERSLQFLDPAAIRPVVTAVVTATMTVAVRGGGQGRRSVAAAGGGGTRHSISSKGGNELAAVHSGRA